MAVDKKISELDSLAAAGLNLGNDFLVIVDTDSNITKKITPSNLMSGRVSSETINHIVMIAQNEYEAPSFVPEPFTLYIVTP